MASIQPIVPGTDTSLAYNQINQNFRSIDQQISKSGFIIVKEGSIVMPQVSVATGVNQYGTFFGTSNVDAHNLGFVPVVIAFLDYGTTYVPLPWTFIDSNSSNLFVQLNYRIVADETNVTAASDAFAFNVTTIAGGAPTAKYFLLQKTVNQ
jgi:hypothetical protein